MRPEHLRDMMLCGRQPIVARLAEALQSFLALAQKGRLPDAWQVVLRTRAVFPVKKNSETPRPIRIGE
eukprot:2097974-Prorocentrum_lima.AAC.1